MENLKLYNASSLLPNKLNFYRKNSLAQKIRKDLLRLIIYKPQLENEKKNLVKKFEELTNTKFKSVNELLSYDFNDVFFNNLYREKITNKYKLNPSFESLELIKLFEKINNDSLDIFVHGSHADGRKTNYSDLDVSIFINNKKNFNLNRIKNDILILNNYVKSIDLESHHSIFLNLRSDLNCYPESFMPISVFNNSVTPKKQNKIIYRTRFSTDIALDSFIRIYSSINNIILQNYNHNNFYNIKFIISSYFMLIILNYEIIHMKFLDKKTIFKEFLLNKNNNKFLNIFNLCSEIRANWPNQNGSTDIGISNHVFKEIHQHSKSMLEEIENSLSLKKTLEIILK